ncbi:uncharacterized protein [Panulirus ornatus]|uniref:uncharacterized protein isoform X3 n=1 Tax=Panulirus ornatus TaxID=150431 RepID=UPI003A8C78EF
MDGCAADSQTRSGPLATGSDQAVVVAVMVGLAVGAPQYDYETPKAPPSLYETPTPPPSLYETPAKPDPTPKPTPTPTTPTKTPPPMVGMPYDFQFGVEDQDSGNAYSHVENSDGRTTQGEYRVLLPDGRTQVVTFSDNGKGFTADVTYQ